MRCLSLQSFTIVISLRITSPYDPATHYHWILTTATKLVLITVFIVTDAVTLLSPPSVVSSIGTAARWAEYKRLATTLTDRNFLAHLLHLQTAHLHINHQLEPRLYIAYLDLGGGAIRSTTAIGIARSRSHAILF